MEKALIRQSQVEVERQCQFAMIALQDMEEASANSDGKLFWYAVQNLLGTRSTLIPMDIARVNDERQLIEVASDKDTVKSGPSFDDDREITPDFEIEVYSYFGLQRSDAAENGAYYSDEETAGTGTAGPGITMGDIESGTFREHPPGEEGVYDQSGSDPEDELRVQRTEEELTAGTRERE